MERPPSLDDLVAYVVTFRDSCFDSLLPAAEAIKRRLYSELYPISRGVVVLSTCNRIEAYLDAPAYERARAVAASLLKAPRELRGREAAMHILRVASGLESAIIGEDEILGQVRDAWVEARRAGYSSELLDAVFHSAVSAGARARSETGISRGAIGYPQAAVELAAARLGGLSGRRVLVVGAGMAARAMIRHLCSKWTPSALYVADRTPSRAEQALGECRGRAAGRALGLGDVASLEAVDVALVAIKGGPRPELEALRGVAGLVVDISMPAAAPQPDFDYRDVERFVESNIKLRLAEVPKVEAILEDELARLEAFVKRKAVDHYISSIMRVLGEVMRREALVTAKELGGGEEVYRAVMVALNSMTKKALGPLFSYLRQDPEGRAALAAELAAVYESMLGGERLGGVPEDKA